MIEKPSLQLPLEGLELEQPQDDAGWVSLEEARLRELEAQRLFEDGARPEWYEEYEGLVQAKWPFRVAMYIAWAASPREGRRPGSLQELANMMGLTSPRAIHTWRAKNPAIDQQVGLMQAAPLFKHRADAIQALADSASNPDYRHAPDRRTFFMMTGDLEENINLRRSGARNDLGQMSDAELAELASSLGEESHHRAGQSMRLDTAGTTEETAKGGRDE